MINIQKMMVVQNEHLYGPGKRLLIYLKGCSIHCEGCVNRHLWSFTGGQKVNIKKIIDVLLESGAEGLTLHGGEPLDQSSGLLEVVNEVKKMGFTIVLFTGYIKKELNASQQRIWNMSDIVVSGRFVLSKRNINLQYRGSTNQKIYFHKGKYKNLKIKDGFTTAIITLNENGEMDINGFLSEEIEKITNFKE